RYSVCASVEYASQHGMPVELDDLRRYPIITSNVIGRDLRLSAYQGGNRCEVVLHPTLATENFQFLRKAILAGLGVGLVPDYVIDRDVAAGTVVTALTSWRLSVFGTRMYLLRMPGRYQTLAVRTLIDYVVERAREWSRARVRTANPSAVDTSAGNDRQSRQRRKTSRVVFAEPLRRSFFSPPFVEQDSSC